MKLAVAILVLAMVLGALVDTLVYRGRACKRLAPEVTRIGDGDEWVVLPTLAFRVDDGRVNGAAIVWLGWALSWE